MSIITIDISSFVIPNGEPAETCSICLQDDMTEGLEHRVSVTVAHRFHTDCAERWGREQGNCAICRGRVTSVNGVPLHQNAPEEGDSGVVITDAANDTQIRQMRASAIGVHTGKYATGRREEVLRSIPFVNALVPVRFNADGSVATDLEIDEQAAQQARILLAARLAELEAEMFFL